MQTSPVAFLSYSSTDQRFADEVATGLERASVIFDKFAFTEGEQISVEIARRIVEAGLFVLLASPEALRSKFVQMEIKHAETLVQAGAMASALVFTFHGVTHHDLPGWMAAARTIEATNPVQVAMTIRERQVEIIEQIQGASFVNRHNEQDEAQRAYFPADSAQARRGLLLYGRPGSGRRALSRKIHVDRLRIAKSFLVNCEPGDDASDLVIKMAQFCEVYDTRQQLRSQIESLEAAMPSVLHDKFHEYMATFTSQNTAVIFNDVGGVIAADGTLTAAFDGILTAAKTVPNFYYFVITKQRPRAVGAMEQSLSMIKVPPLSTESAIQLASEEAARRRIPTSPDRIEEIVAFVGGHPSAIRYAVNLAATRGLDVVLADKRDLAKYRIDLFSEDLRTDGNLREMHRLILSTLDYYSPLPLNVIVAALGRGKQDVAEALGYLLDCVFVQVDSENRYALSSALSDVVASVFPEPEPDHDAVLAALEIELRDNYGESNPLALERARFGALSRSSRASKNDDVIALAADYIIAAQRAYRAEDYQKALDFATIAVERRASDFQANRIYIQALVKRQQFEKARSHLTGVRASMPPHDFHFFRGFIFRGERKFEDAALAYEQSIALRRGGLSIHRELAMCYFRLGRLEDAAREIAEARRRGRDNPYVLDLEIQVLIAQNKLDDASKLLIVLEKIDRTDHPTLARASITIASGDFTSAIEMLAANERNYEPFPRARLKFLAKLGLAKFAEARNMLYEARKRYAKTYLSEIKNLEAGLIAVSAERRDALLDPSLAGSWPELVKIRELLARDTATYVSQAERHGVIRILLNHGVIDHDIIMDESSD